MNTLHRHDPAVDIEHLRVVRGSRTVIEDLNLRIPRGQVVGLLGPSGCGKTTLMRSIVGVQQVAGGTVEVLGEPAGSARLRHRVGYLTQAPSVYRDLTVRENVRYFAQVSGCGAGAGRGGARVLDAVDLTDHACDRGSTCPAASCRGCRLAPRSSASRSCSCSTSRPSGWIRCSAATCGPSSTGWRAMA